MQPQPEQQPQQPQQPQFQQPVQPAPAYPPQPSYYTQPQVTSAPASAPANVAEQFPVDYLNQISSTNQVRKASPFVIFGLIGGVLLLVAGALFFFVQSAAPPDVSTQVYALQARLDTLAKVTDEQGKHLTQNELSSINSTIGASLTSMTTDLTTYAKARGIKAGDKSATSAKTTEAKYYAALSKKLDDAYLLGTLDRTYSTEMKYQLSILKSKLQRIKTAANSKTYNDFYTPSIASIDTVVNKLSSFQSTK